MAHGMKIRNNGNIVVVDQNYENLSLRYKNRFSQVESNSRREYRLVFTVECTSSGVLAFRSVSGYAGVIWYTQINENQKKVTMSSYSPISCDVYVFDKPSMSIVNGNVGLRVRHPNSGTMSYDSRCRYMKILGFSSAPAGASSGQVVTFDGGGRLPALIPVQHYRRDWHGSFDTGSGPAIQEYGGDNLQSVCSGNAINIKIDEWTYTTGGTSSSSEEYISGTGFSMFVDVTGM